MHRTRLFFVVVSLFCAHAALALDCQNFPDYLGQNTAFETDVAAWVNYQRAQAGLPALQPNTLLNAAAQKHAMNMACQHQMAHQLNGVGPGTRISNEGYTWFAYAENVAAGYESASSVVTGWMNSPGHRDNILDAHAMSLSETGVGAYRGPDGRIYYCQVFARPQ